MLFCRKVLCEKIHVQYYSVNGTHIISLFCINYLVYYKIRQEAKAAYSQIYRLVTDVTEEIWMLFEWYIFGSLAYAEDITISCPNQRELNRVFYICHVIPLLYVIVSSFTLRKLCAYNMENL